MPRNRSQSPRNSSPKAPGTRFATTGSDKRSKTAQLTITTEDVIPLVDKPPGSTFKGHEDFVVQDLVIQPCVIRHRRERRQPQTAKP